MKYGNAAHNPCTMVVEKELYVRVSVVLCPAKLGAQFKDFTFKFTFEKFIRPSLQVFNL